MEGSKSHSQGSSEVLLTPEGLRALQEELEHLTLVKRPEIADRLRDSKQHGEFSEDNSELDEVKFEQAMVENRIADLKAVLANARSLAEVGISDKEAGVGTFVTLRERGVKTPFEIRLVASMESDPERNLVSIESPLGVALMGKKVGDTVEIEAPAGKKRYEVLKLRRK